MWSRKITKTMSENKINQEAYKQAEKELMEGKVKHIKGFILETLEKIEKKKAERDRINEEIRILNLDLEDLRSGKFEKIEDRIEKSKVARGVSIDFDKFINDVFPSNFTNSSHIIPNWNELTAGTYIVNCSTSNRPGFTKTIYF